MDDKIKVQLCKKLIREFYENLDGADTDDWMALAWSLETVLDVEEEKDG